MPSKPTANSEAAINTPCDPGTSDPGTFAGTEADTALRKTRVGVLMESLTCSPFLFETLAELAADDAVELHLLLHRGEREDAFTKAVARLRDLGIGKFVNLACFRALEGLERRLFGILYDDIRNAFREKSVSVDTFATTTHLHPIAKKANAVDYPDADVDRVQRLDLDLILRGNATGIFKGRILSAARHGIISFHHGDNRWNRGRPPGFWEVYQQRPATGFVIQLLNDRLDDGKVIFRGEIGTLGSYTQNLVQLMQAANPFMARLIRNYAAIGTLPQPYPGQPFSHSLLKYPDVTVTCRYALRTFLRFGTLAVIRRTVGMRQRWSVAFLRSDWQRANLSRGIVIDNPPGRFLADPFVVTVGDDTVVFVEDFDYGSGRGMISAVRILPDEGVEIIDGVLRESFHLSYPYVFRYGDALYMIPESREAASIRLYRCTRFPDRWEFVHELMQGVAAVDTMLIDRGAKWWMLTNIGSKRASDFSHLYAFSAADPLSREWQPHRDNPLRSSAASGRNGGLLRDEAGNVFRVRQRYGFNRYGAGCSIARIVRLDDDGYDEAFYCDVEANFMKGIAGTHHMHCNGTFTVFDFDRDERLRWPHPARGDRTLASRLSDCGRQRRRRRAAVAVPRRP